MKLGLNEYQIAACELKAYPEKYAIIYPTLGLLGEAGEVADKMKKVLRGDPVSDNYDEELGKELGDVLWYLAVLADDLDLDLEEIAMVNLEKLQDRKARGVLKGNGDNR